MHIVVESNNEELLDLLTPDSIRVSLIQRLHFGDDAAFWPRFSSRLPPRDVTKTVQQGIAVWWRGAEPQARSRRSFFGESTRSFSGELFLKGDLVPCCQILHYSHEVRRVPFSSYYEDFSQWFTLFIVRGCSAPTSSVKFFDECAGEGRSVLRAGKRCHRICTGATPSGLRSRG